MPSVFRIKTSSTTPTLIGAEGSNILKIGEFGYSFVTGDSDGGDRLFIGIGPDKGGGFASEYVTIGGQYYTHLLSAPIGKLKGGKALIVDSNGKIDQLFVSKISALGTFSYFLDFLYIAGLLLGVLI